jgi:predicted Zn-dependent protease
MFLFLSGCTTVTAVNPVTLKNDFMVISENTEINIGRKADPGIIQEFGYYNDPVLQSYVNEISQKLVQVCARRNIPYYFKVLDSPIENAFALPGGYIYITRGLLAILDSEAELAGVLGHEIGHVVGRDSANLISQGIALQLLALGGVAAGPSAREVLQATNMLFNSIMLGYGREKEFLADAQGVEYMFKAGYDPMQMTVFQARLSKKSQTPVGYQQYNMTHPDIFDRMGRTAARAKVTLAMDKARDDISEHQEGRSRVSKEGVFADDYLAHIDGLAYGPSERLQHIKIYTVHEGDTLKSIAERVLGDPKMWREIADLNDLKQEDMLYPGEKLKIIY